MHAVLDYNLPYVKIHFAETPSAIYEIKIK